MNGDWKLEQIKAWGQEKVALGMREAGTGRV